MCGTFVPICLLLMEQIVPKLTFKEQQLVSFRYRFLFTTVVPFHLHVELSFLSDCSFEVKVVPIQNLPFPFKVQKGTPVPLRGSVLIVRSLLYF